MDPALVRGAHTRRTSPCGQQNQSGLKRLIIFVERPLWAHVHASATCTAMESSDESQDCYILFQMRAQVQAGLVTQSSAQWVVAVGPCELEHEIEPLISNRYAFHHSVLPAF